LRKGQKNLTILRVKINLWNETNDISPVYMDCRLQFFPEPGQWRNSGNQFRKDRFDPGLYYRED
jgi:hypothetical protein